MKTPMHSFELSTPSDMLRKAKRELERMKVACAPLEENHFVTDHGLNFAITAWHIADWVWKTYDPNHEKNIQGLGLIKKADFFSLLRKQSEALAICYEIATGSKHMTIDKGPEYIPRVEDTHTSARPVTVSSSPFKVLKVVLANGQRKRADEIFADAVAYWDTFFDKYNIC